MREVTLNVSFLGEERLYHTVYDYIALEKGRNEKIEDSEFQVYRR